MNLFFIAAVLAVSNPCPENIALATGAVISNATVQEVEGDALVVSHPKGVSRIPFPELSAEMQRKYGYDPIKSKIEAEELAARDAAARQNEERHLRYRQFENRYCLYHGKAIPRDQFNGSTVTGQIVTVIDDQRVLLSQERESTVMTDPGAVFTSLADGPRMLQASIGSRTKVPIEPIAVSMDSTSNLVDGQELNLTVVPDGTYKYTSVSGALRTVKAFKRVTLEGITFEKWVELGEPNCPTDRQLPASSSAARKSPTPKVLPVKVEADEYRAARTWNTKSGTEIRASLVKEAGAYVLLKRADGTSVQIPFDGLSKQDQRYVEALRP
jgi:hypothetical protein